MKVPIGFKMMCIFLCLYTLFDFNQFSANKALCLKTPILDTFYQKNEYLYIKRISIFYIFMYVCTSMSLYMSKVDNQFIHIFCAKSVVFFVIMKTTGKIKQYYLCKGPISRSLYSYFYCNFIL